MYAAAAMLGVALPAEAAALGFAGTLVVYGVDRVRDLERDRSTTPARTAFVERHRRLLVGLSILSAAVAVLSAVNLPPGVWAMCAAAGALGFFHRRLKHVALWKTGYVTLAWVAVCVGIPVAAAAVTTAPTDALRAAGVIGLAIAGNLVASNLRDRESGAALVSARRAVLTSTACCTGGVLVALVSAPMLAPIPLLELAAVAGIAGRPSDSERYGLVVVDGALTVGALISLAAIALAGG